MKAFTSTFPDIREDEAAPRLPSKLNYPRPVSEPPSPISSRVTTPGQSRGGTSF